MNVFDIRQFILAFKQLILRIVVCFLDAEFGLSLYFFDLCKLTLWIFTLQK